LRPSEVRRSIVRVELDRGVDLGQRPAAVLLEV